MSREFLGNAETLLRNRVSENSCRECMVRRLTARESYLGKGTVCVNVFGLSLETMLRAHNDDPRVLVLISRAVAIATH